MTHALVEQVTAELVAAGDPARAEAAARYLKSELDFLGVRLPAVRALVDPLSCCP